MTDFDITFQARLWLYSGDKSSWHFITLPPQQAAQISFFQGPRRGFGAVRVRVEIGNTSWETSIFPHKDSASYILPVKAEVRRKEGLQEGDIVSVAIRPVIDL